MSFIEAVILGIVQGLTEFLPVSSSGHLRIVPAIAGWQDPGAAFTAVIQIGTMAAVIVYFRHELFAVARDWTRSVLRRAAPRDPINVRLGWYLALGTLPIVFSGFIFKDQIETVARDLYLIGTMLIVFGLALGLAACWRNTGAAWTRSRDATRRSLASPRRSLWCRASRVPAPRSPPASRLA